MKTSLFLLLSLITLLAHATGLETETTLYKEGDQWFSILHLKWENSWKNEVNHDAAWIFFKIRDGGGNQFNHVKVAAKDHTVVDSNTPISIQVTSDRLGLFVQPNVAYRSNIEATVKVSFEASEFRNIRRIYNAEFNSFGIEMVYIPEGPVSLGDPDPGALDFGALYKSDKNGKMKGQFLIDSENQQIKIGPGDNELYYQVQNQYQGDQQGELGPEFPKGYAAFYIMKYEPTEGQYLEGKTITRTEATFALIRESITQKRQRHHATIWDGMTPWLMPIGRD